ncbi:MAG: helix-turn-helix domain-containing protein [Eubacteriales bacterium]|nr:helix-turn-helix domain-containing protein [Eubacteriales bacterium]
MTTGERHTVLQTATRLFCDRGYRNTGMGDICDACRLDIRTLHGTYPNKAALFAAVTRPVHDVLGRTAREDAGSMQCRQILGLLLDPACLRRCLDKRLKLIEKHRNLLRLLLFRSGGYPGPDFRQTVITGWQEYISGALRLMHEQELLSAYRLSAAFGRTVGALWVQIMEEIVRHPLTTDERERYLTELTVFLYNGNKGLFRILADAK